MKLYRGLSGVRAAAAGRALTIGNFDGVHRGHQAMLALLVNEARHRGCPACVLTFEPHPRDYFAGLQGHAQAPLRVATLRDKLAELQRCGVDEVVVHRFGPALASLSAADFIDRVIVGALGTRYLLVGDDFRFGSRRAGDYAMLDAAGSRHGFDVARMMSYEVHGQRVSSSAVRQALSGGDMTLAAAMLGRSYAISGRVIHGRKLGRQLGQSAPGRDDGFRTLNQRFGHPRPAAQGIFVSRVHGLGPQPLQAVSSLGVRPSVEDAGRVLLETHCLQWPAGLAPEAGYGCCLRVDLLHRLHEERHYESMQALQAGIAQDVAQAHAWFHGPG